MTLTKWDQRIRRAVDLISFYPFAAEGLRFYERIATFQKAFYSDIEKSMAGAQKISVGRPLRDEFDPFLLLPNFSGFLALIHQIAPQPLALIATAIEQKGPGEWQRLMEKFWWQDSGTADAANFLPSGATSDTANSEDLLSWIFLQPYAEYLAEHRHTEQIDGTPSTCPLCGSRPIVGVLRPEGDGAKKSLICMLCAYEWTFRRIYCPSCGEERESHMAFYSAPDIPHVRVDVCDTCRIYLKTVDLTKTGLAVPVVDELATLPLDLWAREQGYCKLQMNVVGI